MDASTSNPTTLLLGFAFGLWADGSPGKINERLASLLSQQARRLQSQQTAFFIGAQWEIADALSIIEPDYTIVAGPPMVKQSDIIEPEAIRALLLHSKQLNVQQLRKVLQIENDVPLDAQSLSTALNEWIKNADLHETLSHCIDFEDLQRPEKRFLGLEKRSIPREGSKLRPYQKQRVNRLVLESIFPEHFLKRGQYLSTSGVSKYIITTIARNHAHHIVIDSIQVFAHPCHVSFCIFNTANAVKATPHIFSQHVTDCAEKILAQWEEAVNDKKEQQVSGAISLQDLSSVGSKTPICCKIDEDEQEREEWWDAMSAQVWTRTKDSYETYQNM